MLRVLGSSRVLLGWIHLLNRMDLVGGLVFFDDEASE